MKIQVDPDTSSEGFGYVEAGQYRLRVVNGDVREGNKAPYIAWEFEHVDPNLKAVKEELKVGHVYDNTTLKVGGNAQFKLKQLLDAVGQPWGEFEPEELYGREFDAELGIKEYEGKFSNEVKRYIPLPK